MTRLIDFARRLIALGGAKASTNGGVTGEELEIDQRPYEE
jgi:hypothetical protein